MIEKVSDSLEIHDEDLNVEFQEAEKSFDDMMSEYDVDSHNSTEVHCEMARIGYWNKRNSNDVNSNDTISIWVYGEKRPVKHFHFYRGKDRKYGGCISLEEAAYFTHDNHTDVLNNKEIKQLIGFLNSMNPDFGIITWKVLLSMWNAQNPKYPIDVNISIPPYQNGII